MTDHSYPERYYVLFRSSFRCEASPNISHETIDKVHTLCGRKVADAALFEPDSNNLEPDCTSCRRVRDRMGRMPKAQPEIEAQLKCAKCASGHRLGALRTRCGAMGCECWCNRG